MPWNPLVIFLVAILFHGSWGEGCRNNAESDTNEIDIHDCDTASYKKLMKNYKLKSITEFYGSSQSNKFSTVDDHMFRDMSNLNQLKLEGCEIEKIDENAFCNSKKLTLLRLTFNKIKNLHEKTFRNLGNLNELNIGENLIETIPAKLFEGNRKLTILWMAHNKIKEIPIGFFDSLTVLEMFSINHNELALIHGSTFKQNKKLRIVCFNSNKIRAVAEGTFNGLANLTWVNFENNSCINKDYGSYESSRLIGFNKISSDFNECYGNYGKCPLDLEPPQSANKHSTDPLYMIIVSISILLSVCGVIIISLIKKNRKVVRELKQRQEFEMKQRESCHYYSMPDN
jgi:Leucine-rich repeat (LRR) protein